MQAIDPAVLWRIQKKTALVTALACVVAFAVGGYFVGPLLWSSPAKAAVPVKQDAPKKR